MTENAAPANGFEALHAVPDKDLQVLGQERSREAQALHDALIAYLSSDSDTRESAWQAFDGVLRLPPLPKQPTDQERAGRAERLKELGTFIGERSVNGTTDLMYALCVPFTTNRPALEYLSQALDISAQTLQDELQQARSRGNGEAVTQLVNGWWKEEEKARTSLPPGARANLEKARDEFLKQARSVAWKAFQRLWHVSKGALVEPPGAWQHYVCALDKGKFNILLEGARYLDTKNFETLTGEKFLGASGTRALIRRPTKDGFNLLLETAKNGNADMFNRAVELVEKVLEDDQTALKDLVTQTTRDDFNLLLVTAKNGTADMFNRAVELVEGLLEDDQTALKDLVTQTTRDGFNLLLETVKNGTADMFTRAVELVEKVLEDDQTALKDLVTQTTKDGFNLLLQTAKNGTADMFTRAVELVKKVLEDDQTALKDLVTQTTRDDFNLLLVTAKNGTADMFNRAVELAKTVDGLETMATQRSTGDFTLLHNLCRSAIGASPAVWQELEALPPAKKQSLIQQATTPQRRGFLPLHEIFFSQDACRLKQWQREAMLKNFLGFVRDAFGDAAPEIIQAQMGQDTKEASPRSINTRHPKENSLLQKILDTFVTPPTARVTPHPAAKLEVGASRA